MQTSNAFKQGRVGGSLNVGEGRATARRAEQTDGGRMTREVVRCQVSRDDKISRVTRPNLLYTLST